LQFFALRATKLRFSAVAVAKLKFCNCLIRQFRILMPVFPQMVTRMVFLQGTILETYDVDPYHRGQVKVVFPGPQVPYEPVALVGFSGTEYRGTLYRKNHDLGAPLGVCRVKNRLSGDFWRF
jgi:hypothetical protein